VYERIHYTSFFLYPYTNNNVFRGTLHREKLLRLPVLQAPVTFAKLLRHSFLRQEKIIKNFLVMFFKDLSEICLKVKKIFTIFT